MNVKNVKLLLKKNFNISNNDINNLEDYVNLLLERNAIYNLISKNTENTIWSRHILDSAQLLKFFDSSTDGHLADFGTGAGLPGLVLAICNKNPNFHVKLYEKSPVKREFLNYVMDKININVKIEENVYGDSIITDYIVVRAFKKLDEIIKISREIVKKPHKIIVLKGKNAQEEINNVSLPPNYSYKMENSITEADSKIIIIQAK